MQLLMGETPKTALHRCGLVLSQIETQTAVECHRQNSAIKNSSSRDLQLARRVQFTDRLSRQDGLH